MITEKGLNDVLKNNRTAVIQYNLKFPEIGEANSKINEFIYAFTKKYEDYIKSSFFKYAANLYENDTRPRKHLHFKPFEVFQEYKITYNDGNILCVLFDMIIRRDGRVIGFERFSHTFDIKNGLIVPPKYLVKGKKAKKQLKKLSPRNFYIENKTLVGFENKFGEAKDTVKIRKSDLNKFIVKTQEISLLF